MKSNPVNLTAQQCKELEPIVTKLISHYKPENIICFGSRHATKTITSCFIQPVGHCSYHYFLLMVTADTTRIEHEVQDFVNRYATGGNVTIIVHGIETITNAIAQAAVSLLRYCATAFSCIRLTA
jgi:hypothetical protein